MKHFFKIFLMHVFIIMFSFGCTSIQKPSTSKSFIKAPSIKQAKRIVFLGDSITFQGDMVVNTELWLKKLYPNKVFEIINVGLPSETITGLSEAGHAKGTFPRPYVHDRLISVLDKTQPDLIIAMYGINCGIYQSFNDKKDKRFQQGYLALNKAINERNIPAVYITPPMYDHQKGSIDALDYNDKVLGSFSNWLLQKRVDGWHVIDLYNEMNRQIITLRKDRPDYFYQHDGIHMVDDGYWLLTDLIMNYFEPEKIIMNQQSTLYISDSLSLAETLSKSPQKLLTLTNKKMQLTRDAWLTYTGHTRPKLPVGLPMNQYKIELKALEKQITKILDK